MPSITLTLSEEKLQFIERERKANGETQSEVVARALSVLALQNEAAEKEIADFIESVNKVAQMNSCLADYWDDDYAKMSRGEIPYDGNRLLADTSEQTEE